MTKEDFIEEFEKQKGVCFYSGIRLEPSGDWTVSIERVNPNIGYVKENIVLVCSIFNGTDTRQNDDEASGNWTREKFSLFKESILLKSNV